MRRETKNLLLWSVIAIVTLAGTNADAKKRAPQAEDGILADATAEGPKGYGFLHTSITNLSVGLHPNEKDPAIFGDVTATLRLRVKGDVAVFQTKILSSPDVPLGIGFSSDSVDNIILRELILVAFQSVDLRLGGIVADVFFPGEGFSATLKVLDEDAECDAATAELLVVGCPLGPDAGDKAGDLTPIIKVADVTIAFTN